MRGGQRRLRVTSAWVIVVILAGCVWWGIHPPRTEDSYRRESASTLELLRSDVETANLWLESFDHRRVTSAAAEVALTETETDADRRASSYSSYQPPDASLTTVRADVSALADQVVTALGEIRVDVRADRWEQAVAARTDLERLSRQLTRLQRQVAP